LPGTFEVSHAATDGTGTFGAVETAKGEKMWSSTRG
jgi:hypothetical protein